MSVEQAAALKVAQLARNMAEGYRAHIAAIRVAPRLDGKAIVRLIADYPSDFVQRKDGTKWSFDTQDALVSLADKAIAIDWPMRFQEDFRCFRVVLQSALMQRVLDEIERRVQRIIPLRGKSFVALAPIVHGSPANARCLRGHRQRGVYRTLIVHPKCSPRRSASGLRARARLPAAQRRRSEVLRLAVHTRHDGELLARNREAAIGANPRKSKPLTVNLTGLSINGRTVPIKTVSGVREERGAFYGVSGGTTLVQPGTKMQFRLAVPLNL